MRTGEVAMIRIAGIALTGIALAFALPVSGAVAADQAVGVTGKRMVVKHRHHYRSALYPCPDGYGCYPLYGAYGPYGGRAYWSSFSYLVPSYYAPRP
jgi:hypothetical protein